MNLEQLQVMALKARCALIWLATSFIRAPAPTCDAAAGHHQLLQTSQMMSWP